MHQIASFLSFFFGGGGGGGGGTSVNQLLSLANYLLFIKTLKLNETEVKHTQNRA